MCVRGGWEGNLLSPVIPVINRYVYQVSQNVIMSICKRLRFAVGFFTNVAVEVKVIF